MGRVSLLVWQLEQVVGKGVLHKTRHPHGEGYISNANLATLWT